MVVDTKLYDTLGISPEADSAAVKKAYRDLARRNHPDKGGDPEKFKEIQAAYQILSDDNLRGIYDSTGSVDPKNSGMPDMDILKDLFENMRFPGFDIFNQSDPFSRRTAQRTSDAVHELHLPLDVFYTGKTKNVNIKRNVVCKGCNGKGGSDPKTCDICHGTGIIIVQQQNGPFLMQSQRPCHTCKGGKTHSKETMCKQCTGSGHRQEKTMVEVKIPPGAPNRYVVTLKGMSDERVGHETGDLHFQVIEKPHDTFTRYGADLATKVAIDLPTALVGGIVTFRHLDGNEMTVTLPKGKVTRYGDVLTIAGQGMPNVNGKGHGDLRVTFHIELPSDAWATQVNEAVVRKIFR